MKVVFCLIIAFLGANANQSNDTHVPDIGPEYLDQLRAEGRYEEFAKITGLISAEFAKERDTEGRAELPRHEAMYNKKLERGDIMPMLQKEEEARQGIRFEKYGGSKWQNGRVPYAVASDYNENERKTIQNGIDYWNNQMNGCIQLVPRNGEKDYVYVYPGDGCWSYIGRIGGSQQLSLQKNGCLYRGTIVHEFQHAIGFAHEQNCHDRDNYIDMLWENIPDEWKSQYEKTDPNDFNLLQHYDYYSIMHYPVNAPGTNKKAFQIKYDADESRIGNGNGFTDTDKEKIKDQYCR